MSNLKKEGHLECKECNHKTTIVPCPKCGEKQLTFIYDQMSNAEKKMTDALTKAMKVATYRMKELSKSMDELAKIAKACGFKIDYKSGELVKIKIDE